MDVCGENSSMHNNNLEMMKKRKLDVVDENTMDVDTKKSHNNCHGHHHHHQNHIEDETTAAEALTMLASNTNNNVKTTKSSEWTSFDGTIPLSMNEDSSWLIPLHCFVRKHLHIFHATEKDLKRHNNGKAKPVQIGQIGICCPYCLNSFPREQMKAGVYFPSTIHNIYSASLNLLTRHMPVCEAFPEQLKRMYDTLKSDEGRSASSKKYWYDSARKLGLIDTDHGIRYAPFNSSTQNISLSKFDDSSNKKEKKQKLVVADDAVYTTEFIFYIMKQYQKCNLSEADRIGRRQSCPINFPGLECTHCQTYPSGGFNFGSRLFPTSFKSFSDTTKTIAKMNKHLLKCRDTPLEVKSALLRTKVKHDQQKREMRIGSLKAFCTRVWNRLHDNAIAV